MGGEHRPTVTIYLPLRQSVAKLFLIIPSDTMALLFTQDSINNTTRHSSVCSIVVSFLMVWYFVGSAVRRNPSGLMVAAAASLFCLACVSLMPSCRVSLYVSRRRQQLCVVRTSLFSSELKLPVITGKSVNSVKSVKTMPKLYQCFMREQEGLKNFLFVMRWSTIKRCVLIALDHIVI
jgi:hypothetical protein